MEPLKYILRPLWLVVQRLGWSLRRLVMPPRLPRNPDGAVYINVGCGRNSSPEFVNVDAVALPNIHFVHDVRVLPMFSSNTASLLYASHVLEHIPRSQIISTLREWARVLKPGGVVRLSVPDFDQLHTIYEKQGRDVRAITEQLLGAEASVYDDHHSIWNKNYLRDCLVEVGFGEPTLWDPATADHRTFHDKAERFVEIAGERIPISLNLEAVKL